MGKSKVAAMHVAVWFTYVSIAIFVYGYRKGDWPGYIYETSISHFISACIFYSTALYILPKYWDRGRYGLISVLLFSILALSVITRFFFAFYVSPYLFNTTISSVTKGIDELTLRFSFQWFTFSLYAVFYWQKTSKITLQKKLSDQIAENTERQKRDLENAALRAQINPHFIFNTLEHFRSQTVLSNPEVSHGITCFMQILRAGIIRPDADGKIQLDIETAAIDGTIFIFQQRFPKISISHSSEIKDGHNVRILPHILLPFVENAFKHGAYDDLNNAICIDLFIDTDMLKLHVSNKKGKRIKDDASGIGIMYVKRHLEESYKDKHSLTINQADELFTVDLIIYLN